MDSMIAAEPLLNYLTAFNAYEFSDSSDCIFIAENSSSLMQ